VVKLEVLIAVEDMLEVTGKGMITEAIKLKHQRVLYEGEDPGGTSLLVRTMIQHPWCKINSEYFVFCRISRNLYMLRLSDHNFVLLFSKIWEAARENITC